MKEKVCIVTGANSGIGLETARGLAQRGATVILACRNKQKGEVALADIKQSTGNGNIHLFLVNLDQQSSIRTFAKAFLHQFSRLDVLVNNAGIFASKRKVTPDGLESTFAVNHIAYFLLTHLLLDCLKQTPNSRVVNVSSNAHHSGQLNFSDLQSAKSFTGYKVYAASKLANILFTTELTRRLKDEQGKTINPTVNSLHPGVVATNIVKDKKDFSLWAFFFNLFSPFFLTSTKGAQTSLYLATSSEVAGVSGKYFDKSKEAKVSKHAANEEDARRLFDLSLEYTGLAS